MNNRHFWSFHRLFGRYFPFFLRYFRFKEDEEQKTEKKRETNSKQFSLTLGDFFNRFGNRDSENDITSDTENAETETALDNTKMLDLLKTHEHDRQQDMHEDENGALRSTWRTGADGNGISDTEGDSGGAKAEDDPDGDNSFRRESDSKLGRENAHGRVSSKLNSVMSESDVPEYVVFDNIGRAKKIIDWRRVLRQNASYEVDWSYRNAVVEDGIVRPTLEAVPIAQTEILLDTSGSIDEPLLKRFLQECKNILPYSRMKVGCFDTQFYGFTQINTFSDLDNMVFEGRHGTSFFAALEAFSGRADNKIIFTDGDAPMPSKRMDVIWIVFGGKKISPNGGRVFYVDDDMYNRLKTK